MAIYRNRYKSVIVLKVVTFCLLLLAPVPVAWAQKEACDCFVKGVVRDKHTGQPIPGATIAVLGENKGVSTDINGRYQIERLCPGQYELECRIIGYQPYTETIDLVAGHEENFTLAEDEIHLKDVEITAHRTDAPLSQPISTLTGSDLAQTRGQSLAESLKGITGVTTLQTGSNIAKPVIHGLHSNRVLIMNNGVRQEGQQWGSEHAPEIDPFVATRVTVVKGAAGVRFGSDAIGGVILVEPEELPIGKALSGELNTVGYSNGRQGVVSGTLQGGVKGVEELGWRAQGTFKRGGNIHTPNYFLDNTGSRERNFSVAAGYRKKGFGAEVFYSHFDTQLGIFSGAHIGSVTDLLQVIKNREPLVKSGFSYTIARPYQDVAHNLVKGEAHYHFADGHRIQWVSAWQHNERSEYDLHRPRNDSLAGLNRPELTFRLTTFTNDIVWDHKPIANKMAGQVGISTLYQYNLMNGRPLIPNFDQLNVGAFLIERLVQNGWEWEAGIRYDYRYLTTYRLVNRVTQRDEFRFSSASGTLGVTRSISEKLSTRLNVGTAWRAPNVSELFSAGVHHGAASYEEGDPTLRPEQAINTVASVVYDNDKFNWEIGAYHNYIARYIYLKPQPEPILTVRGAFPYFRYTQTDATFTGIDASLGWKLTDRWSLKSKGSYLRVYDQKNDQYLVMIPPNRWDNQLSFNIGEVGRWQKLFVSAGNLWVGEQRRVPANSDFAPPPPAYSLWNLTAGGTLFITQKQQVEVGVTVHNLLDTAYRDYLNRFRYYADEMGRNISLRLKWKFGA
ncbi:TonB-dependent receptor [Telluribacter humicola]